jgi:4-oxalocrotonate tautomerase
VAQEVIVPIINVQVLEGVFSDGQKEEMISKLTETMVGIEGEALRPYTWVLVDEVKSGLLGIGGNVTRTADVQAIQNGG